MRSWIELTERYLHLIFIGALSFIYFGLYLYYGDALHLASQSQDWVFAHFNDVKLNFDTWKHDLGGTHGVENFYLVSMSFWLPILISKVTGIPILFLFRAHFLLLPIIIIFVFYKILSLFYNRIGDRILPCALIAFDSWKIFKVSLSSGTFIEVQGYYSNDFFIFFLASLYFLLRNEISYSGIFIFFGILVHPTLGVVANGYLIISWWFVFKENKLYPLKENKLYPLMVLLGFIGAGVVVELVLLKMVFPLNMPILKDGLLWDAIVGNGHFNFLRLFPSVFLMFALSILLMVASAYQINDNKIIKKLIILGVGYLVLMFLVYNIGFLAKIPDVMRLEPLRFSTLFLFVILLAVQFPKTKSSAVAFTIFLMVFFGIHGMLNSSPAPKLILPKSLVVSTIVLVGGLVLTVLIVPKATRVFRQTNVEVIRFLFILIITCVTLVTPLLNWSRAVDDRVLKIEEAIKFADSNIKGKKTFLLWGEYELMIGEIFRTLTHSPTIKLHKQGLYVYNGSKLIYDDEMKRIRIMFDKVPESIHARYKGTLAAMVKPFTKKKSEFYKNEYGVTHIIIFSSPEKTIDSVGDLLFDNNLIEIRAL